MMLDLTCQACDASFEIDLADLFEEPRIQCPSCEARAPRAAVEELANAIDDLGGHLARLRPRFSASVEISSDDLAHERARPQAAEGSEDEEEQIADEEEDAERGFRSDE